MKNQNKHIVIVIFLLLIQSGCGVRKILTKSSSQAAEHKEVEMTSLVRKDQSSLSEQGVVFSDSSRHNYQVTIFPRDSFRYSAQDGFRGMAQRIEISGSADHLLKGGIYENHVEIRSSDSNALYSEKSRTVNRTVSKELTKQSPGAFILIVIAFAVLIGCSWWKFRHLRQS